MSDAHDQMSLEYRLEDIAVHLDGEDASGMASEVRESIKELADLTARLKQAEAERDEALKMAERIDEALKKIPAEPADYSRELQSTDDWIEWCKKQEPADWYGINFHLGLRSGIVYGNILFSNILKAAKSEKDAAIAKLADVEKELSVLRGAVISALGIGQVVGGSKAQLTQLIKNP